jgi:hypothetical protein
MVLGESHYSDRHSAGEVVPDMTEWVVNAYFSGDADPASKRFCSRVAELIRPLAQVGAARKDIWNSLVFYNYIPVVLTDGPRKEEPTREQWAAGCDYFFKVMMDREAEAVIVLGDRLWHNMEASHEPFETFDVNGRERWLRRYFLHGSAERSPYRTLTAHVPHPTGSYGFSPSRWRGVALHLRARAIAERRRTGTPLEGLA